MPRFTRTSLVLSTLLLVALTVAVTQSAQAQTFSVIHSFQGTDGDVPSAGLTMDRGGNFYGTTQDGGSYNNGPICQLYFQNGCGTVFKLSKHGSGWLLAPLFLFNGTDGGYPRTSVTIGPNGSIYGSTGLGGRCTSSPFGCGTIFNLTPGATVPRSVISYWSESVLHDFSGNDDGGDYPSALIFDSAGNMYGTTVYGGPSGAGIVFEFSPSGNGWSETVLYSFTGGHYDGEFPHGVIADRAFNHLFGTTSKGGEYNSGIVFELTRSGSGWTETILHNFTDGSDGAWPHAPPIMDAAGNLYGTNSGAVASPGTVWEMSPSVGGWTFTVLYTFTGLSDRGPYGGLAMDATGNLYGMTYDDGLYGKGNVFKLSPSGGGWIYTDLYDFTGGNDGGAPLGSVTLDASGNIYGTTSGGGLYGVSGVIWEITP